MNHSEAFKALLEGVVVRVIDWREGEYIYFGKDGLIYDENDELTNVLFKSDDKFEIVEGDK